MKPFASCTAVVLLLSMACAALAVTPEVAVPLYGRYEASFTADGDEAAGLSAELTAPDGQRVVRPGFHAGGRTYKLRFMPTVEGRWTYVTKSSLATLDGRTGSFWARRSERPATRFQKHGPVRVAASGRHLEHLDGTPFFFLSDTAWNGALLSKEDHWDAYLKDRVAKRFTAVQFVILSPWRTAPTNAEGQVGFEIKDGRLIIHPEFYDRIDRRMDQVEAAGLLSVPVLMWAWGKKDAGQTLSEEDAAKVIRYEVARYGAHPVLWILNGDGNYRGPVAERWKKIGRAVFAEKESKVGAAGQAAGYHAPVTLHPGGSQWPYAEFRDEAWVDVWGYQSSHSDSPANFKWVNAGPVSMEWGQFKKVFINLEPPYEDHISGFSKKRFDAFAVRRASWWSVLAAPPAGVTYGGHGIWSWQEVEGPPFDHAYTGVAKRWQEAKDLPGATSMKHLASFFEGIDFRSLRPAPQLLADQPGEKDPAAFIAVAAAAEKGAPLVAYLPVGGTVAFKPDAAQSGAKARWYDPRTGEFKPAERKEASFTAPSAEDWVLLLD